MIQVESVARMFTVAAWSNHCPLERNNAAASRPMAGQFVCAAGSEPTSIHSQDDEPWRLIARRSNKSESSPVKLSKAVAIFIVRMRM